ncbi:MAG TPA: shikimate dehydrogenase, partial [Lachnospiraceae bacterium]|nr:shikimate dehydrogenase [Lachnospiraceae bacterium]
MEINGETRILGIIGKPIRHTMSPVIHNMISEAQGRNMVYVPFEVENDAAAAVKGAYALGIIGMNVTVPYKTAVTESLLEIEELAERIGAVNTLVRTETGFKGYNTDISGLERELADENVSLEGRHVLLLGAGGAARAAAFLCVKLRAASVTILNRTADKAEAIAKDVCAYAGEACSDMHTVVKAMPLNQYGTLTGSGYIALQSTKLGMYPKTE